MYKEQSYFKKKLRNLGLRVFHAMENNNLADAKKNGEALLVRNVLKEFSKKSDQKRVIFDVGANQGDYSDLWLEEAKQVECPIELHIFEPTSSSFKRLEEKFNGQKLIMNNFGLSSKEEVQDIFFDKQGSTLASLYQRDLKKEGLELDQKESIQLKKLSTYIKDKELKQIDFLKIDVEGHEFESFMGMEEFLDPGFVKYIQFEYGGANLDANIPLKKLYDLLTSKGFKLAKIMKDGVEFREYGSYMENFSYSNYLAIADDQ